jgi:hypothetical protein
LAYCWTSRLGRQVMAQTGSEEEPTGTQVEHKL